jgi:hypothetical protein
MRMRFIVALVLGGTLAVAGCGSESGGAAGSGGTGTDEPTITMVAWEAAAGCTTGTRSDVVVTVTATGSGTLVYSGSVGGCDNPIDAAVSMISCPNVAAYPGTAIVTDPEGNSTTVTFQVPICESGSCAEAASSCSL